MFAGLLFLMLGVAGSYLSIMTKEDRALSVLDSIATTSFQTVSVTLRYAMVPHLPNLPVRPLWTCSPSRIRPAAERHNINHGSRSGWADKGVASKVRCK